MNRDVDSKDEAMHIETSTQESPAVADKPARRLKSGSRVTQGHRK